MESQRKLLPPIALRSPSVWGLLGIIGFGVLGLGLFCSGLLKVTSSVWWLALANYSIRGILVAGVYHRYFSHKAFTITLQPADMRMVQFVIAFAAQMSGEGGVLWWARTHIDHHRWADKEGDPHSPLLYGFGYAHMGWLLRETYQPKTEECGFEQYPELVWLDKWHVVSPVANALLCFALGSWAGLLIGFFLSTAVLYQTTFFINSVAHVVGAQPYKVKNTSRNVWWLSFGLAWGEQWHNNHHKFSRRARQGDKWWQIDITYDLVLLPISKLTGAIEFYEPPSKIAIAA